MKTEVTQRRSKVLHVGDYDAHKLSDNRLHALAIQSRGRYPQQLISVPAGMLYSMISELFSYRNEECNRDREDEVRR